MKAIQVDQAGYLPDAPKLAMVVAAAPAREFTVRSARDGRVVLRGALPAPVGDADSGDRIQTADFSRLRRPGRYYLEVAGVGRSWEFAIDKDAYRRAYYLAMRSYYGQRCGTAVDLGPEFAGYRLGPCHRTGAYHASSGKSGPAPSHKGWHDAGDYGRYVVNSGIATGTLLWTYEMFGSTIGRIPLNIPESGNNAPDILNEIRWNLEWMLAMQDADGGVWHKQTSERFCGFVMPEEDTLASLIIGTGSRPYKGTCATADFAAVMAVAARLYGPFDKEFAGKALHAAETAWAWAEKHPAVVFNNPSGISTGAYGDRNCGDERLWAAAELWRTTKGAAYRGYFMENWRQFRGALRSAQPPSWANVAALGLWSWALGRGEGWAGISRLAVEAADGVVARSAGNGYRVSLEARDYIWGSNGVAANYGMQLLVANQLKRDPRYLHAALDNLHYLLGRNTHSLSFVTQVGANPFRHPHHRPSASDKNAEPWPGLLAGGPNARRQDPAMKKLPDALPPAKMYLDEQESYATNEVAINWNAPLVFLLAGVTAP